MGIAAPGSILAVGPSLGLSADEIARIRKVSGHVGCFEPRPEVGSGALFLSGDLVLTAGHIFFDEAGWIELTAQMEAVPAASDDIHGELLAAG